MNNHFKKSRDFSRCSFAFPLAAHPESLALQQSITMPQAMIMIRASQIIIINYKK